jgi:adenylyltransferase/sulfurtransferase
MVNITSGQLAELINSQTPIQLVDVRELHEHSQFNIGGLLIPLSSITKQIDQVSKTIPVVVYCKKGIRSQIAIQRLENKFPFENLFNLLGGMDEWKKYLAK